MLSSIDKYFENLLSLNRDYFMHGVLNGTHPKFPAWL